MEMSDQLHTRSPLSPRNVPPLPIEYETGCSQSWSGHFGKKKKETKPATGIETQFPGRATPKLITTGATLC